MKISYNWLKEFVDFSETPEQIGDILTQTGLEVEGLERVEKIPGGLQGIVVGEIKSCQSHPNADKLKITKVDIGADQLSGIVCGAPNVALGQKVLVATVNSMVFPTAGEPFKIKKAQIRGEVSEGMICAEDELSLGTNHDGIMVLDTDKPNGTPAIELFETGEDHVFEIGLTPNRGDATSHLGTARDLKAYFRKDLIVEDPKAFDIQIKDPIRVTVENAEACPRYSGVTIRGVKVGPSPDWLQWKLRSIGLEPINNIVDITNYICHGIGQPMHAFDADEIEENHVMVKTLPSKTKFTTLDAKERALHKDDLMICNGKSEGMCIAGVFGGSISGVTDTTTAIFLESAYFAPDWVRATAQRHTLSTDASFRYERGTDPDITVEALKRAAALILEVAGGTVCSEIMDIYPKPIEPKQISTSFRKFDTLIGKKLGREYITSTLNWLDVKTIDINEEAFTAIVPPYRSDVTRPADLIEEVLRIYGFNAVELDEHFSAGYLADFDVHEPYKVQENLSQFLAGKGFSEILTNSLTNPEYYKKFPVGGKPVEMLNPSSEELTIMKTSPVYTALESISYNINRRYSNLRFFEFGRSYEMPEKDYKETDWLTLYQTGLTADENWLDNPRKSKFHDLITATTALLQYGGIRDIDVTPSRELQIFQYAVEVKHRDRVLGHVGRLKPELLKVYGIKQEVFTAQFKWKALLKSYKKDISYQPIPKFPEVRRDLSLVLDSQIAYADVKSLAFQTEKKLLIRMSLFSIYEGDKIEKGKKAYAISFILQDKFKTLTDKQIDKTMNGLIAAFEKNLAAIIRK